MIAPDKADWRWHKVTPFLEYSHPTAVIKVKDLDVLTQKVYKFRRQYKDRLADSLPDFVNAHEIWLQRPYQRSLLEGFLIGGAPDEVIQVEIEISKDDIAAYVAMFFDIRGRRRHDVSNMVFQGMPHKGYHTQDRLGVMHRLGWFGGYKLLQAILANGLNADESQVLCANVCKDILRRQMPEIGLAVGFQSESYTENLKMLLVDIDKGKKDETTGEIEGYLAKRVVGEMSLTIADPTVKANLEQPAAEPCYIEAP